MHELLSTFINWYMEHINYLTVTILMAIESSFIPLPSEIVVPLLHGKPLRGSLIYTESLVSRL